MVVRLECVQSAEVLPRSEREKERQSGDDESPLTSDFGIAEPTDQQRTDQRRNDR